MKILLIDVFPAGMVEALKAIPGAEVQYEPDITRSKVLEQLPEVHVVIMNSKVRADREFADHAPVLKLVCRAGVGLDHIDVPLLEGRGIEVFSTPGANADSVAEQTLAMMLSMMHNVVRANAQVKRFQWKREENRGTEALEKTVGIIGYGNCGSRVGEKLRGMGMKVLAYDKYKTGYAPDWVTETGMDQIFSEADVVTLHIPLTEETLKLVNDDWIGRFRKPFYFLNLARGPVTDLDALGRALKAGKVKGAALDVLENENLAQLSPAEKQRLESLFPMENVIFTPHIGGWSFESLERINSRILDRVKTLAASGRLP